MLVFLGVEAEETSDGEQVEVPAEDEEVEFVVRDLSLADISCYWRCKHSREVTEHLEGEIQVK